MRSRRRTGNRTRQLLFNGVPAIYRRDLADGAQREARIFRALAEFSKRKRVRVWRPRKTEAFVQRQMWEARPPEPEPQTEELAVNGGSHGGGGEKSLGPCVCRPIAHPTQENMRVTAFPVRVHARDQTSDIRSERRGRS